VRSGSALGDFRASQRPKVHALTVVRMDLDRSHDLLCVQ
jgi:hypothetical protein